MVVSGPSGAGKTSICERLAERYGYTLSVSATTRAPREGEQDGVEYFFVSREEFQRRFERGDFLEQSEHFDNLYGTPRAPVEGAIEEGRVILLEIDINGARQVMKKLPEAFCVFVTAPKDVELERRLRGRHSESEASIRTRLQRADVEIAEKMRYDAWLINDDLDRAVAEVHAIIRNAEVNRKHGC